MGITYQTVLTAIRNDVDAIEIEALIASERAQLTDAQMADLRSELGRRSFASECADDGLDPVSEETAILSVGREFLPACALSVHDGCEPTAEYWAWLIGQTE